MMTPMLSTLRLIVCMPYLPKMSPSHGIQLVVDAQEGSARVALLENLPSYMFRQALMPSTPPFSSTSTLR
jgi:hypothetical protein